MIFIQSDNRFFLHNPMRFNQFILRNMLESTIQSISFYIGSQSRTFGTVWQHRHVPPQITDKLSLLVNCRVKLTSMSREQYAGLTTSALKPGGSIAPSSRPFQLARVSSARDENSVSTHVSGTPGGTPQSSWRFTTTMTFLWYIMKIYLVEIKMSSAKLQKNFRANVCCPTPKHVTTQLFRNFHYQEFYYTGRQIQLKLKTGVSL